jgi:hypothetical protein
MAIRGRMGGNPAQVSKTTMTAASDHPEQAHRPMFGSRSGVVFPPPGGQTIRCCVGV